MKKKVRFLLCKNKKIINKSNFGKRYFRQNYLSFVIIAIVIMANKFEPGKNL